MGGKSKHNKEVIVIVKGCLLGLKVSSSSLWHWICKNTHESELQACEYTQLKDEKDGVLCGHNVDFAKCYQ